MTSSGSGRRRRPRDRKEQILTAARELIVDYGYRNMSMAQLAERVGITAGALYRHFANKSVLLCAVIERSIDEFAPMFDTEPVTLAELVSAHSETVVTRRFTGVLWARESRNLSDADRVRLGDTLRGYNRRYAALIGAERPELAPHDAERLAWGVMSVFASAGFHTTKVPDQQFAQLLSAAAIAVSATKLPPRQDDSPRHSTLQPVSKREQLLSHAVPLFNRRGYEATGLDDIGEAAGVSGPNLYSYFESKGAILAAAEERGTNALWLGLHAALDGTDDPATALSTLVDGYARVAVDGATLSFLLLAEPALANRAARARQREYVTEWVALCRTARPDLDETSARVLVHTALGVINHVSSMTLAQTADRSGSAGQIAAMAGAVLDV